MAKERNAISGKKIINLLGVIVFSLAFIFSCMKGVLPLGRLIVGTFGHITYPLFLILALVELAKFLGFSYTRNVKATVYMLVVIFSLLFVIHSISTYKLLKDVVNMKTFSTYISYSYNTKVTMLGAVGSIVAGGLASILGGMGTIIVFVILLTLFIGILVDYNNYGKYEHEHIKKLKSKTIRKKVMDSDKGVTADGSVPYSYVGAEDSVVGEINVTEEELNQVQQPDMPFYGYAPEDIVGEITQGEEFEQSENSSTVINQTQNQFSDEFYRVHAYPDAYSEEEMNEYRRKFMRNTYGEAPVIEPIQTITHENAEISIPNLEQTNDQEKFDELYTKYSEPSNQTGGFDEPSQFELGEEENSGIELDSEISKILNTNEDEISFGTKSNDSFGGFGMVQEPVVQELGGGFNNASNFPFGESQTNNPRPSEGSRAYVGGDIPVQNQGIMTDISKLKETVVVPPKPIGTQKGMPGVRYNPPPLSLLKTPVPDTGNYEEEQTRKATQLENVLKAFNIEAKVVNIVRGPKITRYELSVPYGVPVKKIPAIEPDIQRSLSAKTITIKAPIPGSQYVGIELENDTFTSVYERELLESPEFQNAKDPLPIAIGKDISGEIIIKSLAKMVHLLIAGQTGSGKSVFIHNLIISLIYKYGPDNLRLVLIDPKKVEFNKYNGLPHLITPEVVMGSEKAINALKWCVKEMDRRYDLMSKAGYNNIEPYNKSDLVKSGQFEYFPYIVIVVDELAEIMCANKKESEVCIQRITQLARACGMHLVLATQRPSVDIITGVIKANVPSRIAFNVSNGVDSKIILNTVGAEKLLGQGDMLFAPTGTSVISRLQAAYASDAEIEAVIKYDKENNDAVYDDNIGKSIESEGGETVDTPGGDGDPYVDALSRVKVDEYFKSALKIVMTQGFASISYLQRRLSIGYSRAAKIIDQMESKGYIAPATGAKQRKVLITPEQFRDAFGEDFNTI